MKPRIILSISLINCFLGTLLAGAYSPAMRIHFGASNAIVRVQSGYFTPVPSANNGTETKAHIVNPLNQLRIQGEAMLMVNNHFNFQESVRRTPARFLIAKAFNDGTENLFLGSLSFGQSLKCRSTLPFFGQIKGYWSIGAATYIQPFNSHTQDKQTAIGGRLGFNCYNRTSAMQSEINIFENHIVANINVYRKISKHMLFNAGVEYNRPLAGLSVLAGNFRINASSRLIKWHLQHGLSVTGNF